jgi:hypothetical protein
VGGVGDVMAVGSPDFHFIEFAEVGETIIVSPQQGELLSLQFSFQGDEHFQAAWTGQAIEVVRACPRTRFFRNGTLNVFK